MSIQSPNYETEDYEDESPYPEGPVDIEGKCRLCLKANELIPVQNGENPEGGISTVALKIDILTTIKVRLNLCQETRAGFCLDSFITETVFTNTSPFEVF